MCKKTCLNPQAPQALLNIPLFSRTLLENGHSPTVSEVIRGTQMEESRGSLILKLSNLDVRSLRAFYSLSLVIGFSEKTDFDHNNQFEPNVEITVGGELYGSTRHYLTLQIGGIQRIFLASTLASDFTAHHLARLGDGMLQIAWFEFCTLVFLRAMPIIKALKPGFKSQRTYCPTLTSG
ncbi:uncharacterized protein H6S33_012905 [Morchella sextelata]|uniref:uncharacterized protein n=1 Tax=Morchella sextelata TaxID=1174677 RepID=UPI001D04FC6E|nr:uncharacterized protein H6S33_012905 [Morchella sextelata]KAH0609419.1 hypothetical protein H6S33_012905 [Morchella sextelata]